MIVNLYIDLLDDYITPIDAILATGKPLGGRAIKGSTRYLVKVDLPVHHFKAIADQEAEVISVSKMEK